VNETQISVDEKNSKKPSRSQREEGLQQLHQLLSELRAASTRNLLYAHLSEVGFGDITGEDLLIFAAACLTPSAEVLIERQGINRQAANQLFETSIQRGYLKVPDEDMSKYLKFPEGDQPSVVPTEKGFAALAEVKRALDKDRWAELPLRSDDIVISTMPKSGTTWVQMICALLIFQTPSLPADLHELSPMMEQRFGRSEIYATLAAQQHRRFIKTHSPLTLLPDDPRVTYIVVARNPIDLMLSLYHQNFSLKGHAPGQPGSKMKPPGTPHEWLMSKIEEMETPPGGGRERILHDIFENLSCAWERRNDHNVVLVHYDDLSADLAGEMHRLAARLNTTVPEDKWPSLVKAATFKEMRTVADQLQPLKNLREKGTSESFFRRGSSGEGRGLLTEAEAARYRTHAAQVAPRELLAWLHRDDMF
jgi:hypothetical protein